jgi:hypothetical protein
MNDETPTQEESSLSPQKGNLIAIAALALIILILFGDVLLSSNRSVLSYIGGDTGLYHVYMRELGFDEMSKGNLPLWNPYVFSGTPFLGSLQAGLLYPFNLQYFFLPIDKAINVDYAMHMFLMALWTFLWMRSWKVHWLGSFYTAVVTILCGATFLRILAGQVNVISTLSWTPLLLMSVDQVIENASWKKFPSKWTLIGIFATSMIVLAGYPQALFIIAFSTAIYTLVRLVKVKHKVPAIIELGLIAVLPVLLTAIQLWTALGASAESVRSGEVTYEFASSYSFPPEDFMSLLTPSFFGDNVRVLNWSRWSFWDDSLFMGVITLLFIGVGVIKDRRQLKWIACALVGITLLVSLGRYTPIHSLLFDYFPGFNKFRAPSKFLYATSLFMAVLAGLGVDRLIRQPKIANTLAPVALVLATVLFAGVTGLSLIAKPAKEGLWWRFIDFMKGTPDTNVWSAITPEYIQATSALAIKGLAVSAVFLVLASLVFWGMNKRPRFIYLIVTVAVGELLVFAWSYRYTFTMDDLEVPLSNQVLAEGLDSDRYLHIVFFDNKVSNFGITKRARSLWGYDPVLLSRYAELMSSMAVGFGQKDQLSEHVFTWGSEPLGQAYRFGVLDFSSQRGMNNHHKLYQMLRCRAVIKPALDEKYRSLIDFMRYDTKYEAKGSDVVSDGQEYIQGIPNPYPQFYMVNQYAVIRTTDELLQGLEAPDFSPKKSVILENEPLILPSREKLDYEVEILEQTTDSFVLRIRTEENGILVNTDSYSKDWKVSPFEDSVQQEYEIMPANHALRAIPLKAGTHHFKLEFMPDAFRYGKWATFVGLGMYLLLLSVYFGRLVGAKRRSSNES